MSTAIAIGLLVSALQTPAAGGPRTAVAVTGYFGFHSDFDTNLHDALIQAGLRRSGKGTEPELFRGGAEAACFDKLAPSLRAAWNEAVDYYAAIISPADFLARQQYVLRVDLARLATEPSERDREFAGIAAAFRGAAAPAYRACRWPAQDARNREWIATIQAQLARHETVIADRLQRLYQKRWPHLPIAVDIVETVSWSRANSVAMPDGRAHLLISPSFEGSRALEIVFHEASHVLMLRDDPVQRALAAAAAAAGVALPPDLWHVVLFFQTGDVTRRVLAEATPPQNHRPILYEIFERGTWTTMRDAVERAWPAYVEGRVELAAAARTLVSALRRE